MSSICLMMSSGSTFGIVENPRGPRNSRPGWRGCQAVAIGRTDSALVSIPRPPYRAPHRPPGSVGKVAPSSEIGTYRSRVEKKLASEFYRRAHWTDHLSAAIMWTCVS